MGTYLLVYKGYELFGACQAFSGDRAEIVETDIGDNTALSFKVTRSVPADRREADERG